MKYLLGAIFLVGLVWFVASGLNAPQTATVAAGSLMESQQGGTEVAQPAATDAVAQSEALRRDLAESDTAGRSETPPESAIIEIGEPIDPQDSAVWSTSEDNTVINIGEMIDPDDPLVWSADRNREAVNIGELVDPGDPATWSVDQSVEPVSIGDYTHPTDGAEWFVDYGADGIDIGESLDPERQ